MLSGDSDDFVLLKLVDGQPSLLFSFGEEVTPLTLYGVKLNDGLWHDLTVSKALILGLLNFYHDRKQLQLLSPSLNYKLFIPDQ